MSKGYIIVFVKMTNKEDFMGNYVSKVADVFADFEGKFLVRSPIASHHEGRQFDLHVIAEFPSLKKATEALESPGYKAILPHRKKNSNVEYGSFMLVSGL